MLPPRELQAYHAPTADLLAYLQTQEYLKALPLCQQQLEQCLTAEALIHLHIALQGLGWHGLAQHIRHLGWLCFPHRFLPCEAPESVPEESAPTWLRTWLSPASPPHVSLCMIVRNGANTLLNCLNSAARLVNEYVIVDTGSTDQTPELARSFSAKVQLSEIPWPHDFAAARNIALQKTQGAWILVLDADEVLLPQSQEFLKAFFGYAPLGWNLFILQQCHLSDSPGQRHWAQLGRIFARHPDLYFHGPLHEQLCRKSPPWYLHPVYLPKVIVEHSGQLHQERQKHQKQERNQLLDQALTQAEYNTPYFWFQKGHVLLYQTQPPALTEAQPLLEKALEETTRFQDKLPPSATWLGAPTALNLYYLLECLFLLRKTRAMAEWALKYESQLRLAESRALAGWSLAKMGEHPEDLLNGFFEPGLAAVHSQLNRYTGLVYEALLDHYLAQRDAWFALCCLQLLRAHFPHPSQPWIQARLMEILNCHEEGLEPCLIKTWNKVNPQTESKQWLKYAFVALTLFPSREKLLPILKHLQSTGYHHLSRHLSQQAEQLWPEHPLSIAPPVFATTDSAIADLPGQWRWYHLLSTQTYS